MQKIYSINTSQSECSLVQAMVKSVSDEKVLVQIDGAIVSAELAFSCLVVPVADDLVLVNAARDGYHILSIIVRHRSQDMVMRFPADLNMETPDGDVSLVSGKKLTLSSAQESLHVSQKASFISENMNISTDKLLTKTNSIESHTKDIKLFADNFNAVIKQVTQRMSNLMRFVEGVETLNIGSLVQNVRNTTLSHSNHAVITAKKDLRIDAERIHMG